MFDHKAGRVIVSVANLYKDGSYHSEIVSQALLGEKILLKRAEVNFSLIEMPDGYPGWISNYQWMADSGRDGEYVMIRSHFAPIFSSRNDKSEIIRDAVLGCWLKVCKRRNSWVQVELPDGIEGWVRDEECGNMPACTRDNIVSLARELLGYPYYWGGRSTKGFDCSGLTQSIFTLLGVSIPRDAWMQHRDGTFKSSNPADARIGDLYFFAEKGTKITHVGLAVGNMHLIHSRGFVKLNSLKQGDKDFSPELADTFVDVRSFL